MIIFCVKFCENTFCEIVKHNDTSMFFLIKTVVICEKLSKIHQWK